MEEEVLDTYEVTVIGPGTRVERTAPAHVAFDVIERLMSAEAEHSRRLSIQGFPKGDDLAAFLEDAEAVTNTKRIVATAQFLRRQGVGSFTRERIRAALLRGGVPTPSNFPRDFAAATRQQWIAAEPGSNDVFTITDAGIEAVNSRFFLEDHSG